MEAVDPQRPRARLLADVWRSAVRSGAIFFLVGPPIGALVVLLGSAVIEGGVPVAEGGFVATAAAFVGVGLLGLLGGYVVGGLPALAVGMLMGVAVKFVRRRTVLYPLAAVAGALVTGVVVGLPDPTRLTCFAMGAGAVAALICLAVALPRRATDTRPAT